MSSASAIVILLHIAIIYALMNALAHRSVEIVRSPIETKIIDRRRKKKSSRRHRRRNLRRRRRPSFRRRRSISSARRHRYRARHPTVITTVKPAPAPAPEPVRVLPQIDAQHSHEPDYPPQSRRLGEQGSLVLQALIAVDGRVLECKAGAIERLRPARSGGA